MIYFILHHHLQSKKLSASTVEHFYHYGCPQVFEKRENDTKSLLISQQIYLHTFPQYQIQDTHNFKKNKKSTIEFIYLNKTCLLKKCHSSTKSYEITFFHKNPFIHKKIKKKKIKKNTWKERRSIKYVGTCLLFLILFLISQIITPSKHGNLVSKAIKLQHININK